MPLYLQLPVKNCVINAMLFQIKFEFWHSKMSMLKTPFVFTLITKIFYDRKQNGVPSSKRSKALLANKKLADGVLVFTSNKEKSRIAMTAGITQKLDLFNHLF
jgi:hypothetical protein